MDRAKSISFKCSFLARRSNETDFSRKQLAADFKRVERKTMTKECVSASSTSHDPLPRPSGKKRIAPTHRTLPHTLLAAKSRSRRPCSQHRMFSWRHGDVSRSAMSRRTHSKGWKGLQAARSWPNECFPKITPAIIRCTYTSNGIRSMTHDRVKAIWYASMTNNWSSYTLHDISHSNIHTRTHCEIGTTRPYNKRKGSIITAIRFLRCLQTIVLVDKTGTNVVATDRSEAILLDFIQINRSTVSNQKFRLGQSNKHTSSRPFGHNPMWTGNAKIAWNSAALRIHTTASRSADSCRKNVRGRCRLLWV